VKIVATLDIRVLESWEIGQGQPRHYTQVNDVCGGKLTEEKKSDDV
jgi:hypothetical protein